MFAIFFTLYSCLIYCSTLKMEAICSSETSVDFQLTTRRYIPDDIALLDHCCENLKSYNLIYCIYIYISVGTCVRERFLHNTSASSPRNWWPHRQLHFWISAR
jgi:hypothetical protein